jgi:hypothetical protein
MYYVSSEVRTEFICYVEESRPPLWLSGQSTWLKYGDVLCFLWGTIWIYICYVEESRPPLWSSGQNSCLQNGDVVCFLWGTNWIYVCYVEKGRPPVWYSGQSSWQQNRDVMCFLWGTNWIYICYLEERWSKPRFFRTFIRIHSLFKSERLSANIKLTLHKSLFRSVMTYACPAWEFAAECHL